MGQPDVAADNRSGPDDRIAAQNCRPGVYDNIILDGWVSLLAPKFIPRISGYGKRAKGDTLINANVFANSRGLTDNHTGSMIDHKALTYLGTGMNVDAGDTMGILGHNARQQWHAAFKQLMGDPVNRNGKDTWIAKNNLIKAFGCGIPFIRCLNICGQDLSNTRDIF